MTANEVTPNFDFARQTKSTPLACRIGFGQETVAVVWR